MFRVYAETPTKVTPFLIISPFFTVAAIFQMAVVLLPFEKWQLRTAPTA